ncbi:MAG: VWA domain-containing protein [Planctomycetota bacterium]
MMLLYPVWLLLAIPLIVSLWMLKPPSRFLQVLRTVIVLLVLLAMARLYLKLPSRRGTVVIVADRSHSMPPDAVARHKESIDLIQSKMSRGSELAVVSFGQTAVVEHPPQSGKFASFATDVGPDASSLAEAIDLAITLVPQGAPGRILVISDGKWTGRNPASVASQAAARGIPVDYRILERPSTDDLAVFRVDAPEIAAPGESFMITVWIRSPLQQEVSYQLSRGSTTIAEATRTVSSGLTRLVLRDRAKQPGTLQYKFVVSASPDDPIPENNAARFLLGVEGPKPVLCVTDSPTAGLAKLLEAGQLDIRARPSASCNWALEDLSGLSAVLIEDIPAEKIGTMAMENIAAWVRETGAGFMMTGGKNSYGPGGYFKSALEPIMPVSMELRQEHRKLSLAIVVALDRSGSMAVSVGGGKTKMDLANLASAQVLDMLSPMDEFGVIAVDSSAHVIVDLASVERNKHYRGKILKIDSMGGGIFVYEALSNAAKMLAAATPQTRHIILFADAADSEQPGKYKELLQECSKAGMTVSVIGLGKPSDTDAWLLRDIATRGQGRCFFTESPKELPRLFAQDTFVVARSSFLEEPTTVQTTPGLISLTGRQFSISERTGGYNLCYIRPNANLAALTVDEYKAPFVAAWQAGIGRALCYTGQADGPFTGDIAKWQDVGSFFTSLTRWVAGQASDLGADMLLTQQLEGGNCLIKLHLDPERKDQPVTDLPKVTTLCGVPGKTPKTKRATMHFEDADTLAVEIPIMGAETSLSTVEVPGAVPVSLPPVCLPYSPEFEPAEAGKAAAMVRLSKATQGRERANLADIWNELPKQPQLISVSCWLLFAAIVLLLLEVLERRTGLLSRRKWRLIPARVWALTHRKPAAAQETAEPAQPRPVREKAKVQPKIGRKPAQVEKEPVTPDLFSALSKAQRSAKARTDRKQ